MADLRYAGRYRGEFLEVVFKDPRRHPTIRFAAAGLADFIRAADQAAKSLARFANALNETDETDEFKAYRAFVEDGGDPDSILAIEEYYGVES